MHADGSYLGLQMHSDLCDCNMCTHKFAKMPIESWVLNPQHLTTLWGRENRFCLWWYMTQTSHVYTWVYTQLHPQAINCICALSSKVHSQRSTSCLQCLFFPQSCTWRGRSVPVCPRTAHTVGLHGLLYSADERDSARCIIQETWSSV